MGKPNYCRHCMKNRADRPRGLCGACYYTPEILAQYPSANPSCVAPEPTAEEIEQLVAEQMACLPDWWPKNGQQDEEE